MAVNEEVGGVCDDDGDWLAGVVFEGGGLVVAGGGGLPGVDLIGGGRRGRSFTLDGLEKEENEMKTTL